MRIVGFGAHPDDIEIFCLGLLAVYQAAGHEIGWVVATDGAKGGAGEPAGLVARRHAEALAAAEPFGVTPRFLDRPDGALAEDRDAPALIEAAILETTPDLVITHAPNDYHPDHRALSRLVVDAARFRVPVLHADTLLGVGSEPSIYVDVSDHFERKLAAIAAHVSQIPERFIDAVTVWNRFRALQCGFDGPAYAEAYRYEPHFPFADIRALLPAGPGIRPLAVR
jgi:LmbE family N-acetylglucosaminyl deacetylase